MEEQWNSKAMEEEREIIRRGNLMHLSYRVSTVLRYHADKEDFDMLGYIDCETLRKFNIIIGGLLCKLSELKGARKFKVDIIGGEGEHILLLKK